MVQGVVLKCFGFRALDHTPTPYMIAMVDMCGCHPNPFVFFLLVRSFYASALRAHGGCARRIRPSSSSLLLSSLELSDTQAYEP